MGERVERVEVESEVLPVTAGLDIGKAEVVCCVRVPSGGRGRVQRIQRFATMSPALLDLGRWLADLGVQRVVMEATGQYWKPVYYALEACGFSPWLVNARDVAHLPGRAKTDTLDAAWLCKVAERGMLRPSFVPPAPIRRLRDLTRYRSDLIGERTRERSRVLDLLEDAGVKISLVASDCFGMSGRAILDALAAGTRDPQAMAELVHPRMRPKIPQLVQALSGHFDAHHQFLLARMLTHLDQLEADLTAVETRVEELLAPFADAVARLDQIPGVGPSVARTIIAEIGADMSQFPTAGHLASWARFAPGTSRSAGKITGPASTGHGDRYLAAALGEAARSAGRTHTFLGARYRRLAHRRGKNRALVAVGRSILVIAWHLLSDPEAAFHDLGEDYYDQQAGTARATRRHIRGLQALGYRVTLDPAA